MRSARLDSLNVAYVAFTRARYELAIYGEAAPAANPKDGDRCKELGQNLLRVLRDELAGDPSIFGRYALSVSYTHLIVGGLKTICYICSEIN